MDFAKSDNNFMKIGKQLKICTSFFRFRPLMFTFMDFTRDIMKKYKTQRYVGAYIGKVFEIFSYLVSKIIRPRWLDRQLLVAD